MTTLREIFYSLDRNCDKWDPYFDVYERHFSKFVGKSPRILEIGLWECGSTELWQKYFGPGTELVGIDIDRRINDHKLPDQTVYLADQSDPAHWELFLEAEPEPFDIILDDGGHQMHHQITTLKTMINQVRDGGVYMCEDNHTSYMSHSPWHAGYKTPSNFIEYTKDIIDVLHDEWTRTDSEAATHNSPQIPTELVERYNRVQGIHYYDSIVVYDIGPKSKNARVRSRNKYMNQ